MGDASSMAARACIAQLLRCIISPQLAGITAAMRAIILAAGQGSRLLPLTADRPKCLVDFNGRSLLDWQLDMLGRNGVDEVLVVTGFRDDQIEAALAKRTGGPRVATLYNPFYKVADNLGTMWIARDWLDGDVLTLNGDTLVSDVLVARVERRGEPQPRSGGVALAHARQRPAEQVRGLGVRRVGLHQPLGDLAGTTERVYA